MDIEVDPAALPLLYERHWRTMYINATQGIIPYGIVQPNNLKHVLIDFIENPTGEWACLVCCRRIGAGGTTIRHYHQADRCNLLYKPKCPYCRQEVFRTWDIRQCNSCYTAFICNQSRVNKGKPLTTGNKILAEYLTSFYTLINN